MPILISNKSKKIILVVMFLLSKMSSLYDDYVKIFNLSSRKDVWNSCICEIHTY